MDGIKGGIWGQNESRHEGSEYTYLDVKALKKCD
jgi:hypothetical protein